MTEVDHQRGTEILTALHYHADQTPETVFATVIGPDGRIVEFTYRDFRDRFSAFASKLAAEGFPSRRSCVLHTGNTASFLIGFFGILEAGGVVVPTIAQSTVDELAYVIEHSDAWGVVTTPEFEGVVRRASAGTHTKLIVDIECRELSTTPVTKHAPRTDYDESPASPAELHDARTAVLMYTSGSSGRPKGVLLTHSGIAYTANTYAEHLRLTKADTVLICMPMFHVNGLMLQLLPALISGSKVVITPKFSVSEYWNWVRTHRITVAHLVSGPIRLLLSVAPEDSDRNHSIRAMTFGLPLTADEINEFEYRFDVPLIMVWGLTETCCGGTLMRLDHARRSEYQNVGPELRGWHVQIATPDGKPCPEGTVGEILVKSPGTMLGYHKNPDATAATLRHGYVASGDLGYKDAEEYVHFVSRMKDMIKPSGENVAAAEVQECVESHPSVVECAVFGVDDPIRIERIIAMVVLAAGATTVEHELREYCSLRVAPFKVPSEIRIVGEIPKTSIGKQRVGDLKSAYLATLTGRA